MLVAILISGCQALASKEATVACQVADTTSSIIAVNKGAREVGLLLKDASTGVIAGVGFVWLIVKLAYHDDWSPETRATLNVIACGAAVNNVFVIRKL